MEKLYIKFDGKFKILLDNQHNIYYNVHSKQQQTHSNKRRKRNGY